MTAKAWTMQACLAAMREVLDRPHSLGDVVFNLMPTFDQEGPYLLVEHGERFEARQEVKLRNWEDFCAWANPIIKRHAKAAGHAAH